MKPLNLNGTLRLKRLAVRFQGKSDTGGLIFKNTKGGILETDIYGYAKGKQVVFDTPDLTKTYSNKKFEQGQRVYLLRYSKNEPVVACTYVSPAEKKSNAAFVVSDRLKPKEGAQ